MKEINYMKGQLELMDKKEVEDVYYRFLKVNGKKANKKEIRSLTKETIISKYIIARNKKMIWG